MTGFFGQIPLVLRLQADASVNREFELFHRAFEHCDRLAVIHMHEFGAYDPFEFRQQPLLEPLVEEGEVILSFVQ